MTATQILPTETSGPFHLLLGTHKSLRTIGEWMHLRRTQRLPRARLTRLMERGALVNVRSCVSLGLTDFIGARLPKRTGT